MSPHPQPGNRVEFLVDGEETFASIQEAIAKAQRHVHVLQLLFEPEFVGAFRGGPPPAPAPPGPALAEALVAAARRGVAVRILLNENKLVWDTVGEMRVFLDTAGARDVRLRGFPLNGHAMHAKLVAVDGEQAFVIGQPFERRFWDSPRHLPMDPRRGTDRPIHDVSLALRGPAVADAEAFFATLWNLRQGDGAGGDDGGRDLLDESPARPSPAGADTVGLARTLPERLVPGLPQGDRGILEAYRQAIGRARRWIYLETQYFTSPTIARLLRDAMDRGVDVILVLNEDVDIPTYVPWQERRLAELGLPHEPRLGVFTLWTPVERPDGWRARPIYVHSKVGIVDDAWCTVGAANLDSISLEAAGEFLLTMPANVELNAVLSDGATGRARELRERLWTEHFASEAPAEPADGWLALWRRTAAENLARLAAGRQPGRILPYHPESPRVETIESRGP